MTCTSVAAATVGCTLCSGPARGPGGPSRWPSLTAAVEELRGPRWRWLATVQLQICPGCAVRLRLQRLPTPCPAHGHDWEPWTELPSTDLDEQLCNRSCARCGTEEIVAADCLAWPADPTVDSR